MRFGSPLACPASAVMLPRLSTERNFVSSLESFFDPKSVAVVGASATPGKPGRTVIENLIANGYGGAIHPVNPRGGDICGQAVSETIEALPDGVDMGIVMLPAASWTNSKPPLAAQFLMPSMIFSSCFDGRGI